MLNDGSFPMYIDNCCDTTSCLDLAILTSDLFTRASLTQGPDLGSDHFPICCKIGTRLVRSSENVPVWYKFHQANWTLYQQALDDALISAEHGPMDADSGCAYLSNAILRAASSTVSQSSGKRHCCFATPWWDSKCSKAVALRRKAKGRLWCSPTPANLIEYRQCEAVAQNIKLGKQRQRWVSVYWHYILLYYHQRDLGKNFQYSG
jgi:hypothetical protein